MLAIISLLSFLLPTQLALHVNSLQTTVYGFQIDYLIPTFYLTDILALLIIFLGIRKIKFNRKYIVYCILYIGFAATNILYSIYYIPALYRWFKVTEMILLGIVILNTKKFDTFKHFIKPLSYMISIACILGIWQFFIKSSVGEIFYWFGERSFIFNNPNITPHPYSFFSHPNSFAGFLLVFGIYLLQSRTKFKVKYFWTLSILVAINLFLTNSLNVYIAIAILLFLKLKNNLVFTYFAFGFSERFITHRVELIKASLQMIKENFWLGVGLNNFIPNLVKVSNTYLNSWELQPVHNMFLLVFSEVGIFGLIMFLSLFSNLIFSFPLLTILITGLSDHYWLTLQQNMLLFTYVLAITKKYAKK